MTWPHVMYQSIHSYANMSHAKIHSHVAKKKSEAKRAGLASPRHGNPRGMGGAGSECNACMEFG